MSAPENDPRLRDAAARDARPGHASGHAIDPDASPDVIEGQIDAKRADISRTLSQLENQFSPNRMMDYVRDNGGEVAENLGRSFKSNPVPFIVTGIGLAWLMSSTQGGSRGDADYRRYRSRYYGGAGRDDFDRAAYLDDHPDAYRDDFDFERYDRDAYSGAGARADAMAAFGGDVSNTTPYSTGGSSGGGYGGGSSDDDGPGLLDKARAKASEIGGSVSEGVDSMKERAGAGVDSLKDRAGSGRDAASEHYERMRTDARYRADTMRRDASRRYQAMRASGRDFGRDAGYRARRGAEQASDYLQEQPLVAAAVGIAVGALIGSLLPATRTEDRYLGEYGDEARSRAADVASERAELLKERAGQVAGDVRERAGQMASDVRQSAEQGLSQARGEIETQLESARKAAEGDVKRADAKADEAGRKAEAKVDEKTTTGGRTTTGGSTGGSTAG